MRFEKQSLSSVRCLAPPTAAVNYHVYCCCGKRQDSERLAGRVGKLESLWHCSGCVSVRGRGLLLHKCTDSEEKLRQARAHLKKARGLERLFSERVTDPDRMAKTGEVSVVILVLLDIILTLTLTPTLVASLHSPTSDADNGHATMSCNREWLSDGG
jgi:hypothetical protein